MRRNLDDFVRPAREPDVAVFVHVRGVAGEIDLLVGNATPVVGTVAFGFAPEGGREAGEGALDDEYALFVGGARLALGGHDGGLDAGHGHAAGAGLDGEHCQAVGVADEGAAGFGLPVVVYDGDPVFEGFVLQPLPGGRVEDLAGAEDAFKRRQVGLGLALVAVAHEQADGGGGCEHAGYAELVGDLPDEVRVGMVDRALEGDGGCACEQGSIDDVGVADYPTNVGGGPPDVGVAQSEAPLAHAVYADLVAAVRVDDEFRLGGGARSGEDVGGLVGFHFDVAAVVSRALREEVVPVDVAIRRHRGVWVSPEDYKMLDGLAADFEGGVNDVLEGDVASGAVCEVGGEDEAGAACLDAVAERARAETCEDDAVDGADADGGEHEHDGFGADGHVYGDAVALFDAHAAQCGGDALDFVLELGRR